MNRDEWKEKLPLIQQFVQGVALQYYSYVEQQWRDVESSGSFDFGNPLNWRRKRNPGDTITFEEAARQHRDWKVQIMNKRGEWEDIHPQCSSWGSNECFRLKPEPKLRAWNFAEVPIGAHARRKGYTHGALIVSADTVSSQFVYLGRGGLLTLQELLKDHEWKWPQEPETAWRPCGVPL